MVSMKWLIRDPFRRFWRSPLRRLVCPGLGMSDLQYLQSKSGTKYPTENTGLIVVHTSRCWLVLESIFCCWYILHHGYPMDISIRTYVLCIRLSNNAENMYENFLKHILELKHLIKTCMKEDRFLSIILLLWHMISRQHLYRSSSPVSCCLVAFITQYCRTE